MPCQKDNTHKKKNLRSMAHNKDFTKLPCTWVTAKQTDKLG